MILNRKTKLNNKPGKEIIIVNPDYASGMK